MDVEQEANGAGEPGGRREMHARKQSMGNKHTKPPAAERFRKEAEEGIPYAAMTFSNATLNFSMSSRVPMLTRT